MALACMAVLSLNANRSQRLHGEEAKGTEDDWPVTAVNDNWGGWGAGVPEQYPLCVCVMETSNPFSKRKEKKQKQKQRRPVQVARESRGLPPVGLSLWPSGNGGRRRQLYLVAEPRGHTTVSYICTHVVFLRLVITNSTTCSLCHHILFTVYRWNFVPHSYIRTFSS
jgi:hypothetical protein